MDLPKRKIVTGVSPVAEATVKEYHDTEGNLYIPAGTPFRRARMMLSQIFKALNGPVEKRAGALAAIPAYKSRGKGRNKPFIKSCVNRQEDRSKYAPHQGARECMRRAV
jgi:hypothetical protein